MCVTEKKRLQLNEVLFKEAELMREVEMYRLDIVGLTSTHSTGTKAKY